MSEQTKDNIRISNVSALIALMIILLVCWTAEVTQWYAYMIFAGAYLVGAMSVASKHKIAEEDFAKGDMFLGKVIDIRETTGDAVIRGILAPLFIFIG